MKAIEAQFDSRCAICDESISEGEEIVKADGDWVHRECAEDDGFEVD